MAGWSIAQYSQVQPPLLFTKENTETLVATLDEVLREDPVVRFLQT
jgi:hypothetical protein